MGRGFEARAAHPCPTQIYPPLGLVQRASCLMKADGISCNANCLLQIIVSSSFRLIHSDIYSY